jgi:hypothetical protein
MLDLANMAGPRAQPLPSVPGALARAQRRGLGALPHGRGRLFTTRTMMAAEARGSFCRPVRYQERAPAAIAAGIPEPRPGGRSNGIMTRSSSKCLHRTSRQWDTVYWADGSAHGRRGVFCSSGLSARQAWRTARRCTWYTWSLGRR